MEKVINDVIFRCKGDLSVDVILYKHVDDEVSALTCKQIDRT